MANDQILTIKLKSDTTDAVTGFKNLTNELQGTETEIKGFTTAMKVSEDGTVSYLHSVQLLSNSLKELHKAQASVSTSLQPEKIITEISNPFKAQQDLEKRLAKAEADKQATSAAAFKSQSSPQIQALNERMALEQSIRVNGNNHIKTEEIRAAQEEIAIRQNLTSKLNDLEKKLLDGTISNRGQANLVRMNALRVAETELTANNKSIEGLRAAEEARRKEIGSVKDAEVAHRGLITRIVEGVSIYKLYNATLSYTKEALLNIPKAGIAFQAAESALTGIFGSEGAAKNLDFLRSVADRAGQSIIGLQEAYGRFAPSAILAGASQGEINKSFQQFAEVGTILHLTTDKMNSLFLALDQMYAKGVVQSEEIKKQLGNVLPGAVEVGAKAMGVAPAAFMDMMKKNLVSAKEFIPKFSELYRTTFGGVDDSVFETVRVRLLSNLHRVANEYNYISVDIFKSTQDMMNNIVKAIADGLTSFRENLTGAGQAVELFSGLLVTRLAVASVAGLASLGSLSAVLTRFAALPVLLTGLSNPISLTIAGIIGLYGSLNNLSVGYNSAQGFTIKFQKTQVALTDYIQSFALVSIDSLRNSYNSLFSTNVDAETWKDKLATVFSGVIHPIDTAKMAIFQFIAAKRALFDSESMAAPKTFAENYSSQLAALLDNDLQATNDFNTKVLEGAKKLGEDKAKAANAPSQVVPPMPLAIIPGEANISEAERKKALAEQYKDNQREAHANTLKLSFELKDLAREYKANGLSISEYFTQKQKLELEDVNFAIEQNKRSVQEAFAGKDKAKIAELEDKRKELDYKKREILTAKTDEETAANEALNKSLQETHALYLSITEQKGQGAKEAFDAANADKKALYLKNGQDARAKELDLIGQAKGLEGDLTDINDKRVKANTAYNESIAKTNILFNTGAIGQFQAYKQLDAARAKEIAQMEETVKLNEQVLNQPGLDEGIKTSAMKRVEAAKNALENLKLEGSAFANAFNTTVGGALENSFAGMITGSMNAKQAMQSFTTSVLADIAKIIANEARSAIIGQLFSFGKSMFGGVASATAGVNTPVTGSLGGAGLSNLLKPVFQSQLAIGGVSSAPGLSKLSGTVLNKPTIIPFASGAALAGEAGPEAIMPLARGSDGKLGVKVQNNSTQQAGNVYNINISLPAAAPGQTAQATGDQVAQSVMRAIAQQEIANANRPGNQLNRVTSVG